jgi:hypothetical protein
VSGLSTPNFIAVDPASGQIFWTEIGVPRVRNADLNGANIQTLPLSATHPTGIAATSSPLPVQLASFSGAVVGTRVLLEWRTLSEVNNFGFFVQRKHESELSWTELPNGFVPGNGTTSAPHDYTFADSSAAPGSNAYRLKQVDLDGTGHIGPSIIANVLTTVQEGKPLAFGLYQNYPNPFNPSTTIRYGLPSRSHVTLAVFNTLGQRVAQLVNGDVEAGHHDVQFDAAELSSGVYFYRLRAGDFVETKRLLLLR